MTQTKEGTLLVLEAGLFPDAGTLEAALRHAPDKGAIRRHEMTPSEMDDAAWDRLLGDILAAKTILTL